MNFQSQCSNSVCELALKKAREKSTGAADNYIIDAIDSLRRGMYGPDYSMGEIEQIAKISQSKDQATVGL